jgi:hypothetical protein
MLSIVNSDNQNPNLELTIGSEESLRFKPLNLELTKPEESDPES